PPGWQRAVLRTARADAPERVAGNLRDAGIARGAAFAPGGPQHGRQTATRPLPVRPRRTRMVRRSRAGWCLERAPSDGCPPTGGCSSGVGTQPGVLAEALLAQEPGLSPSGRMVLRAGAVVCGG